MVPKMTVELPVKNYSLTRGGKMIVMLKDFGCFLNHSLELNDFCRYIYCEATLQTNRHLSGMLRT